MLVSGDSVIHSHIHSFSESFVIQITTDYWVEFPVLYSRCFGVIAIIYIYISCRCGLSKWHSGKKSPANAGDTREVGSVPGSLGQEDPLEQEITTHSSILTWKIPWMEGPGGLQSTESWRVRHSSHVCLSQAPKVSLPQHVSSGNHKLVFDIHKLVSIL